MEELKKNMSDC